MTKKFEGTSLTIIAALASLVLFAAPEARARSTARRHEAIKSVNVSRANMRSQCRNYKPIVIAVIDTGIDPDHPRFNDHIWTNPGETGLDAWGRNKATNQIDDDNNGFVDDVHGWNFTDNSNNLMDHFGHGTHVSGLIVGPVRDNGATFVSRELASTETSEQRCHPIKLMILKYFERGMLPDQTIAAETAAIHYAIKMHAQVINFSSGGADPNAKERAAIEEANRKHILFVAAAGNDHENDDHDGFYPASYKLPNILSVAAVNSRGNHLMFFSNYGRRTVDIAAPGENIVSTLPGGLKGAMSGTSQATAVVTSVIARFLQFHPNVSSPAEIIQHIEQTATVVANFRNRLVSGGRLNPAVALFRLTRRH